MQVAALLDTAISVIFVFATVSLICSFIQETIAQHFNLRGKLLEEHLVALIQGRPRRDGISVTAIKELWANLPMMAMDGLATLIRGDTGQRKRGETLAPMTEEVIKHPLIRDLKINGRERPAKMSADVFADVVIDTVRKHSTTISNDFSDNVASLPHGPLKESLMSVLADSGPLSSASARPYLQNWFDTTMEQTSALYRRRSKLSLFIIGLLFAAVLNVDTLFITEYFYTHEKARLSFVTEAEKALVARDLVAGATQTQRDAAAVAIEKLKTMPLKTIPMGWDPMPGMDKNGNLDFLSILKLLIGFAVTAYAASFGAPFWFQLLKSLVKVRAAGQFLRSLRASGQIAATAETAPTNVALAIDAELQSAPDQFESANLSQDDIRKIQLRLGFALASASGKLDVRTREAIRSYKENLGLAKTGRVDATIAKLLLE